MEFSEVLDPPALRTLAAEGAPAAGRLVASDPPTVWTGGAVWAGDEAWRASAVEHVWAPNDAALTPEGVRLVAPHCPGTLREAMDAGAGRRAGEAVTIAVSVVRGTLEVETLLAGAAGTPGDASGTWWVTASGCPVFAFGGGRGFRDEGQRILRELAEGAGADLADALARAAEAVGEPGALRGRIAPCEDALFACAEAQALAPDPGAAPNPRAPQRRPSDPEPAHAGWWSFAAALGGGVVDRVRGLWAGWAAAVASRRAREPRRRNISASDGDGRVSRPTRSKRRGPVLVALGLAVAIVGVATLWPSGPEASDVRPSDAGPSRTEIGRTPPDTDSPTASPRSGATGGATGGADDVADGGADGTAGPADIDAADPVVAGDAILTAWESCPDRACRDALAEASGSSLADDLVTGDRGEREVSLVDEYGGVAVLRVTGVSASADPQIVVIVRADEKWLVRDVYDVTDQP